MAERAGRRRFPAARARRGCARLAGHAGPRSLYPHHAVRRRDLSRHRPRRNRHDALQPRRRAGRGRPRLAAVRHVRGPAQCVQIPDQLGRRARGPACRRRRRGGQPGLERHLEREDRADGDRLECGIRDPVSDAQLRARANELGLQRSAHHQAPDRRNGLDRPPPELGLRPRVQRRPPRRPARPVAAWRPGLLTVSDDRGAP